MAINPINPAYFAGPNVANIALNTAGALSNLYRQNLASQQQKIQNQALPQQLQQQAAMRAAQLAAAQTNNQYLGQADQLRNQMLRNQAQQVALHNQYYPQLTQAQLASMAARTNMTNQMAKLPFGGKILPGAAGQQESLQYLINQYGENSPVVQRAKAQMNARLLRSQAYAKNANVRAFGTPAGQALAASNPGVATQYAGVISNVVGGPQPFASQGSQSPMTQKAVSPEDSAAVQNISQNQVIDKEYTPQQRQQMTYANSVDNMLKQVNFPLISQYAGMAGKAKLAADKFNAATNGKFNQGYEAFRNFSTVQAPLIVNDLRRSLGGQATDAENKIMANLVKPDFWSSNPQLAMSQFGALKNMLDQNVKAITQTKSQNLTQAQQSLANNQSQPSQKVLMVNAQGQRGYVPANQVEAALAQGFKRAAG